MAAPPTAVGRAQTVAEVGELWIKSGLQERRHTEGGRKDVTKRFRDLTARKLGSMPIDQVKPSDLLELRAWLERQKSRRTGNVISQQTVRHTLVEVQMLFKWATAQGEITITKSPIPERFLPRVPKGRPRPYTSEQVTRLLSLDDPYRWVIRLALATACRWGELCRLQAKDLNGQWLHVYQSKTAEPKRVLLEPGLAAEIRQRVGRLVPFSPSSKGSFNAKVTKRAGFKFNTRRLRHTAATIWLSGGVNIVHVSANLGHNSVKTTEIYAKLLDEARREEMESFWRRTGTVTGTPSGQIEDDKPAKLPDCATS